MSASQRPWRRGAVAIVRELSRMSKHRILVNDRFHGFSKWLNREYPRRSGFAPGLLIKTNEGKVVRGAWRISTAVLLSPPIGGAAAGLIGFVLSAIVPVSVAIHRGAWPPRLDGIEPGLGDNALGAVFSLFIYVGYGLVVGAIFGIPLMAMLGVVTHRWLHGTGWPQWWVYMIAGAIGSSPAGAAISARTGGFLEGVVLISILGAL